MTMRHTRVFKLSDLAAFTVEEMLEGRSAALTYAMRRLQRYGFTRNQIMRFCDECRETASLLRSI